MAKITVSLKKDHPTGTMRRCGFSFTKEPQTIDVDASQLEIIKADAFLIIQEGLNDNEEGLTDAIDYDSMTMNELKTMLMNNDVEYGARASKTELIKLAKEIA